MTNKNIIKGEVMSASNGGATRTRISLLAGSSLAAATLSFGGLALGPGAALAQTATCAPAPASGNGTAAVTYNAGAQNPGITCVYTGTGATVTTNGAVVVSSAAPGGGVNLTAVGADSVTWVSNGALNGGAQTNGPILEATSVSGPISITTAAMTGTQISVTHGINAVSTGGGAISITNTSGNININSSTAGAQQQSAIRAVSTGGNGAVTVSTTGTVTGRVRGIEAQSSGTGALTITAAEAVGINTTAGVGVAAIDARTGTGLLTVSISAGAIGTVNGADGAAILTNAGGDAVINLGAGRTVQVNAASAGALNLTSVGTTTVTNAASLVSGASGTGIAVRAAGGGFTLTNNSILRGRLELGSVTGVTSVTNTATWQLGGAGNMGAGSSTVTNTGTLLVLEDSTFTSLETFNNSATLELRENTLVSAGAVFNASGSSRLNVTTTLDPAGSTACGSAVSGCFDLTGGTTSGVTGVVVTVSGESATNLFNPNPIVLVDVEGGTSAQGHFVIDPASANFAEDRLLGATDAIAGLFGYTIRYNADTQQHLLISAPRADAFEFAPVIHEVLSTWHTTADVVAGRQADLAAGAGGGLWVRAAAEHSNRELVQSFTAGGATFTADNGYSLETGTAIAGFDIVKGGDLTFGVHGGIVRSQLSFDGSDTRDELSGPTAGVYASWRTGPFSLDGTFNANLLEMERTSPTFEDSVINVVTLGGRAEAGWKLGGEFFVQPLVTAAYVNSTIDDVLPTGYELAFEDATSSRAAIGLRAGGEAGPLDMWVVGRAWREFSGDGSVSINNAQTTTGVTFADDLSGNFQEIGAGLSLANEDDTLRGYVSTGAKLADGIDNYSFSLGLRLRW